MQKAKSSKRFGLVDCHCFYVSAERLFRPELIGKPVVALSNNDGCAVSRSDEAKALGVKMGQPHFQLRDLIERKGLICVSSNYALYQDLSNRVMHVLRREAPQIEPYSIDEAWMDLTGIPDRDLDAFGRHIQGVVYREVGIPVGVGISTTKTLAKLANWSSKKWKAQTGAVVDLCCPVKQEKLLRYADVSEIWGIGRRLTTQLQSMGINKAWDLAAYDHRTLRKQFNINVERTSRELSGEYCMSLTEDVEPKQMIACTRSFSERVTSYQGLRTAISTFVANSSRKLREQRQYTACAQVFIRTSPFDTKGMQYGKSVSVPLPCPTYDTRDLLAAAVAGLQQIYIEGPRYAKAGVILSQFFDAGMFTDDLFAQPTRKNTEALMSVLDRINMTHGRGSVRFASEPAVAAWHMKQQLLSPQYTTKWTDVMRVNA
ncbi:translesion error-prone DNA polymerase V subunit UmuC [Pseudomonas aeruginosa]|uniref:translesion error-prone DNA polymerase V subunit UmuC n=1 Tax=Pseudomonas aeruginosa TaxID=287 RepID=UPI0021F239DB|nr:translesion error-prone DNA polymerase V subunit UmuC [Pseudomonas aeruginosa]MCV6104749.1 translesion error-prone DNA polymerase V subunit UmuC [Pseudomonas aeruginosa]MDI2201417.1 translesion error-prone DNA polymerase V subunit UmuC [Pseudomonas aeruginosa]HBO3958493.1 translesion error-prone DNA polymerase V subunit UmuC [Pseudomonas aeruginosa]HCF6076485.1 translesion error-prone DNA polymerase V subunit UmuC [Pseudomonas aeruginosa]HEP8278976.1 translesion error-prone DNA polymerase V